LRAELETRDQHFPCTVLAFADASRPRLARYVKEIHYGVTTIHAARRIAHPSSIVYQEEA
jgi:hypothetical protein